MIHRRHLLGRLLGTLALGLGALLLPGCDKPSAGQPNARKLVIVCTTSIVGDTVWRVAGDRADVTSLMGEGVDPHLYKASTGDVRALSEADVIFYSGIHLEGKLGEVLEKLATSRPVVALADAVPQAQLRAFGPNAHDPHLWFDVSLWKLGAARVADTLAKADPANASLYAANAKALEAQFGELDTQIRAILDVVPQERRVLVTAHDAFGYFARAYGFEVHGIQGVSTESEASLKDVNALVDLLVSRKIPAVFVESSIPRKTIDALIEGCQSRGHAVSIGGQLFSDAMGRPGTPEGTYPGMVLHNARVIADALKELK